ncbi:hypothetical protein CO641_07675 [Lysobacteraceae bacterium NML91-0213]|nr:hypothetical protein CO641_07675 [Xanthomonadaceae bacterium NML91-0213]
MRHRSRLCVVVAISLLAACQREAAEPPAPTAGVTELAVAGDAPDASLDALRKALGPARMRAQQQTPHVADDAEMAEHFRRSSLPLEEFLAEFEPRAAAGDREATLLVASRLSRCHKALAEDTPERLLQELEREQTWLESRPDGMRQANIERQLLERLQTYEGCSALPAGTIERSFQRAERLALSGDPGARSWYVDYALAGFRTREQVIRHVEEVARRRTQVRRWLEDAVQAGDVSALITYANHLNRASGDSLLYPEDRRAGIVYGYARDLAIAQRNMDSTPDAAMRQAQRERRDRLWREGPERYGDGFSPAERDAMAEEGRRIFERFYHPPSAD